MRASLLASGVNSRFVRRNENYNANLQNIALPSKFFLVFLRYADKSYKRGAVLFVLRNRNQANVRKSYVHGRSDNN